ncbi:MAG: hypothetical protein RR306_05100, partial [Clostridia bacterium]
EKENSVDVVILGDSESYCTFSPILLWKEYGYTSYVLGTAAQPLFDSYEFLKIALKNQKPKMVVLETDAIYVSGGIKRDVIGAFNRSLTAFVPFFEHHDRWKNLSPKDLTKIPKYTYVNELKGFNYRTRIMPWKGDNYMKATTKERAIPAMPRFYIEKIKALCDEEGIKLVLVSVPTPHNWNYEKHNAITRFSREKGIDFLDLNFKIEELQIDWNVDSYDAGDHLNYNGAKKVNTYIGQFFKDNYDLVDHRNDEYYSDWYRCEQVYDEIIASGKGK